jgi:hypothetical protein
MKVFPVSFSLLFTFHYFKRWPVQWWHLLRSCHSGKFTKNVRLSEVPCAYVINQRIIIQLNKDVVCRPNWEGISLLADQQLHRSLWKLKLQYRVHKLRHRSLNGTTGTQSAPFQLIYLKYISLLSSHLRLDLLRSLLHSDIIIFSTRSTGPVHPIFLYLNNIIATIWRR